MKIAILIFAFVVGRAQLAEAIYCYECGAACPDGVDLSQWQVPCNGLCGYHCLADGTISRVCSAGFWFSPNGSPTAGSTITSGDGSQFYFCSGDRCNAGAESCSGAAAAAATTTAAGATTTAAGATAAAAGVTTTSILTGPAGYCYECNEYGCPTTASLSSANSVPCNGVCGYRCPPGGPMQRVCSSGYWFPNPVPSSYVAGDGTQYLFCSGSSCNNAEPISCSGAAGAPGGPTTTDTTTTPTTTDTTTTPTTTDTTTTPTTTDTTTTPTTTDTTTTTPTTTDPCPGVVCQNNGLLDTSVCACNCPAAFTGTMCETLACASALDDPACGVDILQVDCPDPAIQAYCPLYCGLCPTTPAATTTDSTTTTTPTTTDSTTTACTIVCQNNGQLILPACTCSCPNPQLFGTLCENVDCNAAMLTLCNPFTPSDCAANPSLLDFCPNICGSCQPAGGSPDSIDCLGITAADCTGVDAQFWKMNCPVTCQMVPPTTCSTTCLNFGSVDPNTCTCMCMASYTGADCGTLITPCPAEDPNVCGIQYPAAACVVTNVQIICPLFCAGQGFTTGC